MSELRFEWHAKKAAINNRKHGVTFEEAATVFSDDEALLMRDPEHSDTEDRYVLLGMSSHLHALVVCHCYRVDDQLIGLITARKANRSERKTYRDRWRR